jgi:HPt (histidine-containing phosphotransfer) domain-containing protein
VAELNDSQREELEAIRQRFALKVPEKIRAIEQAAGLLPSGTAEPDAVEELGRLAHGLAGSAAIFGFGQLAAAAAELEALVISRPENAAASAVWTQQVAGAVRRIRQASA